VPGGLLAGLTKTVLETALETALGAEMAWIASDDLNRSDPAADVRSGSMIATAPACGNTDVAVGRGGVLTLGSERASTRRRSPPVGGFYDRAPASAAAWAEGGVVR
jgi:hypothetical protein